jgi:hypothetical protein
MSNVRASSGAALIAALCLGAVMTLGDYTWAALHIRHRVAYGLAHGAVMCLCIGLVIGVRTGRPMTGAVAGPWIGMLAAGVFYALAPALRWGALLPSWMFFWILFAALQQRLQPIESWRVAAVRGLVAAVVSGLAFYAISGIWTGPHAAPNYAVSLVSWSFAFVPGFLSLFWSRAS